MEQVINFFKEQGIYNQEFFEYIKDKVHVAPYDTPLIWFGCFPIIENNILKDIRVLVPEIVTEKNLLVNIHEFYHAFELYNELGQVYVENKDSREKNAIEFEESYKLSKKRTI